MTNIERAHRITYVIPCSGSKLGDTAPAVDFYTGSRPPRGRSRRAG